MREINLKIESKEVKSEVRQLKVEWTREMAQDLETNHGLSIDELLKEILLKQNRKNSIKNIFTNKV